MILSLTHGTYLSITAGTRKCGAGLALACLCAAAQAVPLHNWRAPFYRAAAELGLASSSPSGLFWDECGPAPVLDASVWMSDSTAARNHWFFEPAFASGFQSPRDRAPSLVSGRLDVLNDIRYRNLMARQTLAADSRYDDDPFFPAHRERWARGRIEEAYLQLDWQHSFVRFGRLVRNWGPFIDRSLLLSSNPYTYDALEWQVHSSLFEFRHLFAAFVPNDHGVFAGAADNIAGRFFAAHALNLMPGRWVTVGIFESMVFRRENGFPDFQYCNPFSIYSVLNTNQEGRGNLMLGANWNIRPGVETVSLKGQIALDDFQIDNDAVQDREPPHLGIDAGIYWRDALPLPARHLLKAGYQRRSEWLYTVSDNDRAWGEGYTLLQKGLGAGRNDGDLAWAGFSVVGKKWWVGSAVLSWERQGEKTLVSRWADSDSGNIPGLPYDYLTDRFPSGTVESTLSLSLEAAACFRDFADLRAGVTNRWIRNKNNLPSAGFAYAPVFSLELGVHFSDFSVMLPE